jgi:adenine-specific DNA-methyltransferase
MQLTPYHAKYFAHEPTKRCSSDSMEKLAGAVAGNQVDLNPHQVDAALFVFNSPLSRGALLADEVGLGKTIEAGLVLSQKWPDRKNRKKTDQNKGAGSESPGGFCIVARAVLQGLKPIREEVL